MKTINDLVGPDGIIPILLAFRAYPRITNNSALSFITIKKTKTIRKTSNKIRRYYIKQYIKNIFRIRNSLDITVILKLPIQSDIKI
jgi:hypothetical protein